MPLEVIEKIFDYVDFTGKKSLSETCKRFATIFGDQMTRQRRVWLKLSDEVAASHLTSTRTYADFNWIVPSTVPRGFFERMAPTIRSLKFAEFSKLEYFIGAGLTNFVNLTHLDLSYVKFPDTIMHVAYEPVDLNHLEFLSIKAKAFAQLEGQFINFKTKKLHTLEVHSGYPPDNLSDVDVTKIRTLLEQQTRLRVLYLLSQRYWPRSIFNILNQPLVIPSMLHQFKACGMIFTVAQLNNLFNLIRAQTEMTRLDVYNFDTRPIGAIGSNEFENLLEMLLDYPF